MKLLSRNKLNTLVEAVGLVISFTVFIVLMSQVWYDVTFDRSYPGSGRIYFFERPQSRTRDQAPYQILMNRPQIQAIRDASPEVEAVGTMSESMLVDPNNDTPMEFPVAALVDNDFVNVFPFRMVAGTVNGFDNPESLLLSETSAKTLFGESGQAIGKHLKLERGGIQEVTVIGVFKDFPMRNTNTGQEGNAIISIIDTNDERFLMEMGLLIKTQGDHNEARKAIMKVFDEWDEDEVSIVQASTYLEDNFLDGLKPARNNMRMVELFMLLAVLISLLGLVAMSTYYSDIHSNEIAIRKVFGGTVGSESLRSIREYMILVGIACAIGIPIAVWAAGVYLEQFIWKLENYWWIFVVSVILSVLIALISVIWQTLRAARTNPAEALKKE